MKFFIFILSIALFLDLLQGQATETFINSKKITEMDFLKWNPKGKEPDYATLAPNKASDGVRGGGDESLLGNRRSLELLENSRTHYLAELTSIDWAKYQEDKSGKDLIDPFLRSNPVAKFKGIKFLLLKKCITDDGSSADLLFIGSGDEICVSLSLSKSKYNQLWESLFGFFYETEALGAFVRGRLSAATQVVDLVPSSQARMERIYNMALPISAPEGLCLNGILEDETEDYPNQNKSVSKVSFEKASFRLHPDGRILRKTGSLYAICK